MEKREKNLEEFVNEHDKLIAAVGIFGALAEFTSHAIDNKQFAHYLSFSSFLMFLFLLIQLLKSFPELPSDLLYFFKMSFILTVFLFILYFIAENADIIYLLRYDIIGSLILGALIFLLRKKIRKFFRNHPYWKKKLDI